ncbi:MAG: hypothetical protein QNJ47_26870 [Nostocaceae cyanobacterium]|nr:hypothetical protein [Nostocaceae cyanobacterium]
MRSLNLFLCFLGLLEYPTKVESPRKQFYDNCCHLSPELEAILRDKAARQGQDVNLVASKLLATVLEKEHRNRQTAVVQADELPTQLLKTYGEFPDSVELIREDRSR